MRARTPMTRRKTRNDAEVIAAWATYRAGRDQASRNVLMEAYLPIVKYNAERIATKLPDEVENDDLVSAGIFGLMDALKAYEPSRGVKFETYCSPRIRGAILDELRSMDWVPRLVRSRSHKLTRATRELELTLGRTPNEDELAKKMELTSTEFNKLRKDATAVSQVSLSRKYGESDSNKDVCEIDVIVDKRGKNPVVEIQKRDLKRLVTRGLSRAERLILILYYYEEMTMKEIGATLDLSESRVSQMHSSILGRLKSQLETRQKELAQH